MLALASLPLGVVAVQGHWGIDVTLSPMKVKAGESVTFGLTLANSGNLNVTVCRIDIRYNWDEYPQNVFNGSEDIPAGGNRSWTSREAVIQTPGNYSATITVTAKTLIEPTCTSNDWISPPIVVVANVLPTAEFSFAPSTPAPATIVYFTDASRDPDGVIAAWRWDFGDGMNSTEKDPTHAFATAGNFAVVLVVRDNDDGSNAVSHTVQVLSNLAPFAGFSYVPQDANANTSVQFIDGSSDPDGTVVRWRWEFGDGTTSTVQNPVHRYRAAGIYPVVLTVTDNDGASNSVTQTVVISPGSTGNGPSQTGFGTLEWGLLGTVVAATGGVAVVLIKRRIRPSRRWGQTQNSSPPERKKRWRPR